MSNIIDTSEKGYDFVPENSILNQVSGISQTFGTGAKTRRWMSKRFEKIALPILVISILVIFWSQSFPREPIPLIGVSIAFMVNLVFLMFALGLITFIMFSFVFLKTKAGGSQGAIKFNIINRFTGARQNDVENDMLIRRHLVLDKSMARFEWFRGLFNKQGKLNLKIGIEETIQEANMTFDDIKNDPIIAEIIQEINQSDKGNVGQSVAGTTPPVVSAQPTGEQYPRNPYDHSSGAGTQTMALAQQIQPVKADSSEFYDIESIPEGLGDWNVHVLDFTSEYEYNAMKQWGLFFVYPATNINDILPRSDIPILMTVGFTFGNIPSYHTDFVPVAFKEKIPVYYPLITKRRNLLLANLGYFKEPLPSHDILRSAKDLIELEAALPIKLVLDSVLKQTNAFTGNIDKITRRGMGYADKHIRYRNIMHKPKTPVGYWWWALGGFVLALLTRPVWDGFYRAVATWFGIG